MLTKNFCVSNKLGSANTQREGDAGSSLPRRLFAGKSGPSGPVLSGSRSSESARTSRLANKLFKVCPDSTKEPPILRYCLEPSYKREISPTPKDRGHSNQGHNSFKKRKGQSVRNPKSNRDGQFCQLCGPKGSPKPQSTFETLSKSASNEPACTLLNSKLGIKGVSLVVLQSEEKLANSLPTSNQLFGDGRLGDSLGSAIRQYQNVGSLVPGRSKASFQHSRDVGDLVCSKRSRSTSGRFLSDDSIRQQNCRSLYEKRRGHEIDASYGTNLQNFQDIRLVQNPHSNTLPTRSLQRRSRSLITFNQAPRVAPPAHNNRLDFCQIRASNDRSFCLSGSTCSSSVRNSRPDRQPSSPVRRLQPRVGLSPRVGVPSPLSDPPRVTTPQHGEGNIPNRSPTVVESVLASRPQSPGPEPSVHNPQSGQSSGGYDYGPSTSDDERPDFGGVEMWGWTERLKGWSRDQIELLQKGWRPSSMKTYKIAWQKWCVWASENGVNRSEPQGADLAKFLSDLHLKQGLAYSTILVYKSAVSTLCDPNLNSRLSSHVLVKQVLKSISIASVKSKKAPIWDTDTLVKWLKSNNCNKDSLYECSTRAAILLLLCSGRRVHDLTLLLIDDGSCIFSDDSVIFWPKYGSKTDTTVNRQSGWRIFRNKDCQGIDPLFWIKRVITLSQSRRASAKVNNLFITTCGQPKAASRTNIAGWVKKMLLQAGINASPGSTRPAVASKSWVQNCQLDDILARGNWRSENTFLKYYCREIGPPVPVLTAHSISNLFAPVDG